MTTANRYVQIIQKVFFEHFNEGLTEFEFEREEIVKHASSLKIKLPKNLGDLIYSFRYRIPLPKAVLASAPDGKEWLIEPSGRGCYKFILRPIQDFRPNLRPDATKIPDATPGIISLYALNDEQALLAKVRYNRLVDIFSRVTCYSLQSHLRTAVPGLGQVETDEVYVGIDRHGAHYVFPVQAKGGNDRLNAVQIKQDMAMCAHKFPALICRCIGAQFTTDDTIVLFEFVEESGAIKIASEKHYQLVPKTDLTAHDIESYKRLAEE